MMHGNIRLLSAKHVSIQPRPAAGLWRLLARASQPFCPVSGCRLRHKTHALCQLYVANAVAAGCPPAAVVTSPVFDANCTRQLPDATSVLQRLAEVDRLLVDVAPVAVFWVVRPHCVRFPSGVATDSRRACHRRRTHCRS